MMKNSERLGETRRGCELCGKGGGRETRRDWEKLGGTRAVGKLGKERVVVRFGGGGIGWWWNWGVGRINLLR